METLTNKQITEIEDSYPGIPKDYTEWLSSNGWGEHESGYMIYSSPAYSSEIFGSDIPSNTQKILLVGDDMSGLSIGYDANWQLVGLDSCGWEVNPMTEDFSTYINS